MGLAFAAGWTPCIGPILGAILALAAGTSTDTLHGIALLATYSAGLGIPFLLAGLLFHQFLAFFNRFKAYIRLMEIITGVVDDRCWSAAVPEPVRQDFVLAVSDFTRLTITS